MNQEKIGKYIQNKRHELNLTQRELADKLYVSDRTVSKWERGINLPDVSLYEEICKILDISLIEFLNGEDMTNEEQKDKMDGELKKSIKREARVNKIIDYVALFLTGMGLILFTFYNALNCSVNIFSIEGYFLFFISFMGFVILNFNSKKKTSKKIIGMIIFILLFNLLHTFALLYNLSFNVNASNRNYYTGSLTDQEGIYDIIDEYKNMDIDKFIEEYNNFVIYNELIYPIGSVISYKNPFMFKKINFYYDSNFKVVKVNFENDVNMEIILNENENKTDSFFKKIEDRKLYDISKDINNIMQVFKTENNYVFKYAGKNLLVGKANLDEDKVLDYALNLINYNDDFTIYDYILNKKL